MKCVGFDPVSKRAIPRSYVYYLETRVRNLESILRSHNIPFQPPEADFAISEEIKPGENVPFPILEEDPHTSAGAASQHDGAHMLDPALKESHDREKLDKLVNDVGMVSVQGTSDPKFLGSTSGISFARVVFAAVKSSVSHTPSEKGSSRQSKQLPSDAAIGGGTSMRDSFFGLHTKPTIKPAPFPNKELGQRLMDLYFEYANPQIPILHREEFAALLDRVYATEPKKRTARELYLLNIVFAIGSGIIMDSSKFDHDSENDDSSMDIEPPLKKRPRVAGHQHQPEEYHSSAVVHLESFLGSSPAAEGGAGGLEELQAVLLLAGLALLRPVPPGLWYIIGVAVRLAVDLGLHSEDMNHKLDNEAVIGDSEESRSVGRKQWTRDLRRRLWWCVYTFDRLVSTCVGRPFGITDQVLTTEFPSLLDDKYITTNGFLRSPKDIEVPSYKFVSQHYFRLRLLQSEVLQVLQHRQAEQSRSLGANIDNAYIHKNLASPFLGKFDSFRDWRTDIDRRIWEWKESAPSQVEIGVAFTPLFFDLNYYQAVILLYRQSLAVPEQLAGELSPSTGGDVESPGRVNSEVREDEQMVFMKVAQAGQMVLKIYRQLHRLKLVNYTFLATHHLFMSGKYLPAQYMFANVNQVAGISFLYAIWHSTLVRSQLTLDDVDFTVLIATSVLNDLSVKCPPAEACRDAFLRMSKATISMVERTTGFGSASTLGSQPLNSPSGYFGRRDEFDRRSPETSQPRPPKRKWTMPKFDMNLKDLFSDEEISNRPVMQQPKLQNFNQAVSSGPTSFTLSSRITDTNQASSFSFTNQPTSPSSFTSAPPQQFTLSNQQPYIPFAETISQAQPEVSFDDMGFLDTFPVSDPNPGSWGGWSTSTGDLDLGFGTGGTGGYDANGNLDLNGVDLFAGFFFGGNDGNSF